MNITETPRYIENEIDIRDLGFFHTPNKSLNSQNIAYRLIPNAHNQIISLPIQHETPMITGLQSRPYIMRNPADFSYYYANTTNPENHNINNYRYHAVAYAGHVNQQNNNDFYDQDMRLIQASFRDFHYLSQRPTISGSIIDQDHRGTYGATGYLIRTSLNNVLYAAPEDAHFENWNDQNTAALIDTRNSLQQYQSASNLLRDTDTDDYNEVIIGGGRWNLGPIDVQGIFYKTDETGTPIAPEELSAMVSASPANSSLFRIPIQATPSEIDEWQN